VTIADGAFRGRAAALLLLVVVLAGLWLGPVASYLDLIQSGAEQIERQHALLQRYRPLAQPGHAEPAMLPAGDPSVAILLPDLPESQVVAGLQETVKSAAGAAQVQIQGFQMLRNEALPGAVRVGIRVRATGDIAGLSRLLYAIEAARPMLLPDNLQIQSRATPTARIDAPRPLEFQLDISGVKPEARS
jgi:general secretion pathway protein M